MLWSFFLDGFLVLCGVRCGVWSVVWIFFLLWGLVLSL